MDKPNQMNTIPCDEIASGAAIRYTTINEMQYLSVRDYIMHMCEKNNDDAGKVWRNLKPELKEEVRHFLADFKFRGQGQTLQPVITFAGAIKLAMFLPGEKAKQNRSKMVSILQRYYAGDETLHTEIEANAASDMPIPRMSRASLEAGDGAQDSGAGLKRSALEDDMGSEALVKRMKEAQNIAGELAPCMHGILKIAEGVVPAMERILDLKKEGYVSELEFIKAKAQAEADGAELVAKTKARAEAEGAELVAKAKAKAEAEAIAIIAKAKADAMPAPPAPAPAALPAVADVLPADHTTVRRTYLDTYPRFRVPLRKNEGKFLNEARLRTLRRYQAEHAGALPRRVREERQVVDMYPAVWPGILETLAAMHRENAGPGQASIVTFTVNIPK